MFVLLGLILVFGAASVALTMLVARRPDGIGQAAQRVTRTVDAQLERTRQAVGAFTVPDRGTAAAPYFAQDRTEATWLFGIGLLGVAVVFVLGAILILA